MKHKTAFIIVAILCGMSAHTQTSADTLRAQVVYVDDEECGCELVFIDGIQTTTDGERYGFKRQDGTLIADNIYRFVDKFHGDYCKVMVNYDSVGLIDRDGNEIVPCIYNDIEYPSEGRIRVRKSIYYGFLDLHGREIIAPQYRAASVFQEGMAVVAYDFDSFHMEYGYIDTTGAMSIMPHFQYAYPFNEGFAVVKMYERYGMIDHSGKEVVTAKFMTLTAMSGGLYFAGDDQTLALYNRHHQQLTEQVYESILGMTEGRLLVRREGKFGYLDTLGQEIIPCQYTDANTFGQGRAMVAKGGRYGIIDTTGNIVLPLEYSNSDLRSEAYVYHEGLALVENEEGYGFVDLEGNIVVKPNYKSAYQYSNGLAPVQDASNGLWGYIDRSGQLFIPHLFYVASPYRYGRAEIMDDNGVHHIDLEGRCVKNCKNTRKTWRK